MIIMKRTKLTATIGLALGVTIFAGAALANYNTANGYDTFKTAAKGLLSNENYTMNASFKLSIDGKTVGSECTELYDRNGDVKLNSFETSAYFDEDTSTVKRYSQDSDYIYVYDNENRGQEATVYQNASESMANGVLDSMSTVKNEDDKKTVNKIVHFVELAADTFVGDLKNNIVYVSGDDNSSTYEMNLESVQIPELVNAGLSALFSEINTSNREFDEDNRDPFYILGTDPIVKNVSLKFTVDNEGRFTNCLAISTMAGNGHEASVSAEMTISDYGTTKPERVDISTLKDVEYFDYNDHKSSFPAVSIDEADHVDEDGNVLDENGNVVGSIEINGDGEGVIVYNTQQ